MKPYILVADDSPDGREMLTEYLTFRGFAVKTANDGANAIAIALARPPALILMDLTMPGIDGWEATARLKADPRTKDVIILAVTAHVMSDAPAKARAAGADGFVGKPFDLTTFADALGEIVAHGRAGLKALSAVTMDATSGKPLAKRSRA